MSTKKNQLFFPLIFTVENLIKGYLCGQSIVFSHHKFTLFLETMMTVDLSVIHYKVNHMVSFPVVLFYNISYKKIKYNKT